MFGHMRIFLIAIAMAAFAFDLAAIGTLMRPPIILAIEVAFVLGWAPSTGGIGKF
jgi:hypothetical protein